VSSAAADPPVAGRGRWLREVWGSTIGKKVIVAITGAILVVYVVLHVLGNLKAFEGAGGSGGPAVDSYAEWLRTVGEPAIPREGVLWTIRVVLLAALVLHVVGVIQLARRNYAARPREVKVAPRIQRSLSSTTMMLTGVALLAFVVFHILQFTTGTIQVTPVRDGAVYANLYDAFQKWYFVLVYVAAVSFLGLHLHHAVWSVTQTAGWDKPNRNPTFRRFAAGTAIAVAVGFAAVPIAFWTDILPAPPAPEAQLAAAEAR
jgi:succinate dehydrogenase / fumarate reductase cytochrome b subunit